MDTFVFDRNMWKLKICAITAVTEKQKQVIKKKKKHNKTVLLAKTRLNNIESLISYVLINSHISHDEFVLMHHVLKECDDMKEGIKTLKT